MDKNVSDLAIWLSETLKEVEEVDIFWRKINKYIQDWESDNNLRITFKKIDGLHISHSEMS